MSSRPGSSRSSSRSSGNYKEIRLPNSGAVKALIYFCGRDPRKAKSVRRYYDEEDDFDSRSTGSGGSMFSWASGTSQVYLVETTAPYWYWDDDSDSGSYSSSRKRKPSKRGRASRTSQRGNPAGNWARQPSVEDDDDDDDDSSSDGSDYDRQDAGPFPHPGMMPPPPGPPPGAFQTMYAGPYTYTPRPTPPNGYNPMPPPPPPAGAGIPPPPPGGHFVPDPNGIQVFVDG